VNIASNIFSKVSSELVFFSLPILSLFFSPILSLLPLCPEITPKIASFASSASDLPLLRSNRLRIPANNCALALGISIKLTSSVILIFCLISFGERPNTCDEDSIVLFILSFLIALKSANKGLALDSKVELFPFLLMAPKRAERRSASGTPSLFPFFFMASNNTNRGSALDSALLFPFFLIAPKSAEQGSTSDTPSLFPFFLTASNSAI